MKINLSEPLCSDGHNASFFSRHQTLVFAMRVSFAYVVLALSSISLLLAEDVKSQSIDTLRVTVEMNNETLPQLFEKIKAQTGLLFGYRQGEIEQIQPFTLPKQTASVRTILDLVLTNTQLRYKQVNNSVIVFEEEPNVALEQPIREPVTGTVRDKTGTPLPGVSIMIKGTSTGTTTDAEGKFLIEAQSSDVLVFSFIGYKKIEETVGSRILIDLMLEEEINTLNEVVINGGYYSTTDELKTGSIVKITAKEIENQPVTSPLMALQGRVAGLDITPNNGTPGNAPTIRIRGYNSLRNGQLSSNGNYPLYVIDNVPIESTPIRSVGHGGDFNSGGYDPLSTLNIANIASIEVLKDGDATAMYGSRGANGVILITTKRNNKTGEHTNLDLKFTTGVGRIANRVDLLNTQQYIAMRKEMHKNENLPIDGYSAADLVYWDTTRYTDWQDLLFGGTANITDLQGGISGANKNTSFNFDLGYHKETLVTPGDFGYQRGTGNLSVSHISSNQKFKAFFSAGFGVDQSQMFGGDFIQLGMTLSPNAPKIYNDDGSLNWEIHEYSPGSSRATWMNPFAFLLAKRTAVTRTVRTSGNLSYEIFPGITLSTNFGLNDMSNSEESKLPISAQPPQTGTVRTGSTHFINTRRVSWVIEPQVSIAKKWNEHQLNFLAGSTWQKSTSANDWIYGGDYLSDAWLGSLKGAGRVDIYIDDNIEYKFSSLYSRAAYNYSEKYLLSLTVRRDGSSRFGPNNRFGTFWSVGSGWIFSAEKFMKRAQPVLSFGKIRASYGITGSDNVGDYEYYNMYDILTGSYQGTRGMVPSSLYNPDYAWEETRKLDAAIEFAFFDGRLGGEVNWFRNRSSHQLVQYPLPATAGFPSVRKNFEATVQNTGWEIMLRGTPVQSPDWTWNVSFNLTFLNNKLIKFDGIEDSPYATQYKVGQPVTIQLLYTYKGINQETGLYEVLDKDGNGKINDLDKSLAKPLVKSPYGGFINTIRYKTLEISFNLYFARKDISRISFSTPGDRSNKPIIVLDRWQKPGDKTDIQRYGTDLAFLTHGYMRYSDFNIVDGSFIRLRTLSIGYLLPAKWTERIRLQQAKVFVEGQNLFTISKYDMLDPETGSYSMPPLQMVTLGLQLRL